MGWSDEIEELRRREALAAADGRRPTKSRASTNSAN